MADSLHESNVERWMRAGWELASGKQIHHFTGDNHLWLPGTIAVNATGRSMRVVPFESQSILIAAHGPEKVIPLGKGDAFGSHPASDLSGHMAPTFFAHLPPVPRWKRCLRRFTWWVTK